MGKLQPCPVDRGEVGDNHIIHHFTISVLTTLITLTCSFSFLSLSLSAFRHALSCFSLLYFFPPFNIVPPTSSFYPLPHAKGQILWTAHELEKQHLRETIILYRVFLLSFLDDGDTAVLQPFSFSSHHPPHPHPSPLLYNLKT